MVPSSSVSNAPAGVSPRKRSALVNPYDAVSEPDENYFWESLVARDADAFVRLDWSMVEGDFATDRFEGISAHGSLDPADWSLRYPTVEDYRADWLRMAEVYLRLPLAEVSHRHLLYKMTTLARIELTSDRALVWKRFFADEPLRDGERYKMSAQSLYRLHRVDGRWMIVGFVGYLPLESTE